MSKKIYLAVAIAALAFAQGANAQTNFQTFYDLSREHFTTTLEGFYGDKWGNTFFFVDYDYNGPNGKGEKSHLASGSYFEIARCINLWQDTSLGALSAHVEYNGGVGFPSQNFLFGADYFLHNGDFSNTFNFKLLYKTFSKGTESTLPLQFTFVWGMQDIFGVEGLRFSGFADIWGETVYAFNETGSNYLKEGKFVFISEPQIWYNIGKHFGVENLNIGSEVEFSYNFAGYDGFKVRPCIGTKWVF